VTTPWIITFVALWAIVILLALIVLGTLRRVIPLLESAEESLAAGRASLGPGGLPVGARVPPFTAHSIGGSPFTELDLRDTTTVALFIGTSCPACEQLVDDLENDLAPELNARLVVVSESAESARPSRDRRL
jgi:cytochrome oxidase Cu insertion factor (SCO1/SenC/PrrC family)